MRTSTISGNRPALLPHRGTARPLKIGQALQADLSSRIRYRTEPVAEENAMIGSHSSEPTAHPQADRFTGDAMRRLHGERRHRPR